MSGLWESQAPATIEGNIATLRAAAENARKQSVAEAHNFFYGGNRTKPVLLQYSSDEELNFYRERQKRHAHFGVTGFAGRQLAFGVYGKQVERSMDGATDEQNNALADIYDAASFGSNQIMVGIEQAVVGGVFVCPTFSPLLGRLTLQIATEDNVFVEPHPDDPFDMLSLVETKTNPNRVERPINWIWTAERYKGVDEHGRDVSWKGADGKEHKDWVENPYKRIPHAYWRGQPMTGSFWGQSLLEDVIQINKWINDELCDFSQIVLHQAWSQGWVRNIAKQGTMKIGIRHWIPLDDGGEVGFAQPNAPISEVFDSIDKMLDRCIQLIGIPASAVRGGSAASGYALEVEFRSMAEIVGMLRTQATVSEERLMRNIVAVAGVHDDVYKGMPDAGAIDPKIEFDDNFLPRDSIMERTQDLMEMQASPPLLTRKDYLRKWRPEIEDDKLDAYLVELDAEKKAKTTASFGGGAFGGFGSFGADEEGGE